MLSTIWGQLADGASGTVVCSQQLVLLSETEHQIPNQDHLYYNAYLPKIQDDKKSWFMWMDILDWIYHQFFFTANSVVPVYYILHLSAGHHADLSAWGHRFCCMLSE